MEKKSLDYYLSLNYPFKIESLSEEDGGGYFITYPDLPGCMSDGETVEEAISMGEDARKAWIETRYEKSLEIPEPFTVNNKYNGRITVRTPKSLHRQLIEEAKEEGVSLNQYLVYILSKGIKNNYKEF
ncbi:type II toxin-antitoxin system HicB family antitoxin [Tepidibacter formicigenes]|jgi:antitoxin HicB|uniref:Antitoxin HicB n=1 Tax=Tepidibacter formicigenes DSM 15518 TaxID=1123349 RepID=A0A1M6SNU1_9FIRM|nr:type II toxin-antitoxin system HicB family antitoxin [Tepidibacter formicigenes]SHK46363.1 antitoxin HicB [Tepidibacter formicigenes DSM 15518]